MFSRSTYFVVKVSIITPIYNCEKYIKTSVESVLNQTYKDWELILIDDASTDGSLKIITTFIDTRIKVLKLRNNSGPAVARNEGIKEASGRFIAFLDSDDLWLPNFLEKSISFMRTNKHSLVYASCKRVDENLKPLLSDFIVPSKVCYSDLLKTNSIPCLTTIYDTSSLGKVYQKNIPKEDYALWLDILKKIDFAYGIKEPLAMYRMRENSRSRNKFKMIFEQFYIYRRVEKLSLLTSFYYLMCRSCDLI